MKGIGRLIGRGRRANAASPPEYSRRTWRPLVFGVLLSVLIALAVSFTIAMAYKDASTDRRAQVEVVTIEGDSWGLHGVLGAAIDGAPLNAIDRAFDAIEAEIAKSRGTLEAMGEADGVRGFLGKAEEYRRAARNNFAVLKAGDKRSAAAMYRSDNEGLFKTVLGVSARTRAALDHGASAAEARGLTVTTAVLVLSSLILFLLTRMLLEQRKMRAISQTQQSEQQRFRALVDRSPEMITVFGRDLTVQYDSPSVNRMLGWPSATRIGSKVGGSIHPDDRPAMERLLSELTAHPGESRSMEARVLHGDGEYRWVEASATNLCDDPAVGAYVANYRVIEERKRAENLRQQLMNRVINAQEDERKRIAADIHDDSVQVMAAVQLRLHSLARTKGEEERQRALDYLEETVRLSITRLRRLMFELRPASLDRDGLASAIETNLNMMAGETGIEPSVHWSLDAEPPLETRVVLYRIVQEALANVRKHSQARRVAVHIVGSDSGLLVRVVDDGVGFEGPWDSEPGHLGLAAMRERAEEISGWVRIESAPGRGTTVNVWTPLAEPVADARVMHRAGVR